jgi:hypothetical protein
LSGFEEEFFRQAKAFALNDEVGFSGDDVERCPERLEGAVIDDLDCRKDGHSECDAQDVEAAQNQVTTMITPHVVDQKAEEDHG